MAEAALVSPPIHPDLLPTADHRSRPGSQQSVPVIKVITFKLTPANGAGPPLCLGVRIETVAKILSHTVVHGSGQTLAGIAHVGEQEITILDLRKRVFRSPSLETNYLLILKSATGELLGIPVSESPALVDVPMNKLRVLPDRYRQLDTLGMATHVAQVETEEEGKQTVFLLDTQQLPLVPVPFQT